ncbi:hypothetical protein [Calothrix sp. NIES-3974]|uniref:hypothetical protein n=1 Tax=Calothrix sp. NIES-3974 TaxID=2005462 RepID=UPI0012FDA05D|nr:hypothetical protein [Calothrix sp. NIES-3974]
MRSKSEVFRVYRQKSFYEGRESGETRYIASLLFFSKPYFRVYRQKSLIRVRQQEPIFVSDTGKRDRVDIRSTSSQKEVTP